jgi:hypothetical protein
MRHLVLKDVLAGTREVAIRVEAAPRVYVAIGSVAEREEARHDHDFCYWRMVGVTNEELLSVDVDLTSNQVFSVELLLVKRPISVIETPTTEVSERRIGLPVFDCAELKRFFGQPPRVRGPKVFDVFENFELEIHRRDFHLLLSASAPELEVAVGSRFAFVFDRAGLLVSFVIKGLSRPELTTLQRLKKER